MVLVDEGTGEDIQFGHTDYNTGEGRPVTRSENLKEMYVNPELSYEERHRISNRDCLRRNHYQVSLLCKNNTQILEQVQYNPFTEDLSLSWRVQAYHGKRLLRISEPGTEKGNEYLKRDRYEIHLFGENNTLINEFVYYNPFTEVLSLSWSVRGNNSKRLLDVTEM